MFYDKVYGEAPQSAKVRYSTELKRVAGVLDVVLSEREWLVVDNCTYTDLAPVMWNLRDCVCHSIAEGRTCGKTE